MLVAPMSLAHLPACCVVFLLDMTRHHLQPSDTPFVFPFLFLRKAIIGCTLRGLCRRPHQWRLGANFWRRRAPTTREDGF
jgi:hypothetical protein